MKLRRLGIPEIVDSFVDEIDRRYRRTRLNGIDYSSKGKQDARAQVRHDQIRGLRGAIPLRYGWELEHHA